VCLGTCIVCVYSHDLCMRNLYFIFICVCIIYFYMCVYLIAFRSQGDYVYNVCSLPKYYLYE
jgi:hypothetical protein